METKICNKCGKNRHLTEFYGRNNACKICYNESVKNYSSVNSDKIKIRAKQYRDNNKEAIKHYNKLYWENNKEKLKIKKKQYYESNKDDINIKHKNYYKNNKDKYTYSNINYLKQIEKYKVRAKKYNLSKKGKEKKSIRKHKSIENLDNLYVKEKLRRAGIANPSNELIEVKRIIIKTKRLCKTLENSEKN